MAERLKAHVAIDAKDKIGESPAWDRAQQRLLWSDMEKGLVHEARADGKGGWTETRSFTLDAPIAATIPRSRGGLVLAAGIDVLLMDDRGQVTPLARLDVDALRFRFNDAKCDGAGRLWAGTLSRDFAAGAAALYRIDPDGAITTALEGLTLANGLDWSPDGSTFYLVDSLTRSLDAFDFDIASGSLSNRRRIVTLPFGEGGPNGLAVDNEGAIWLAVTGSGSVHRYAPDGRLLARVFIGTPGATSCAFGGGDGGELFITSLGRRMPDVAQTIGITPAMMENAGPEAGALFVCRPGVAGPAARPFAG
jgi:sugar lactone lactonase YvrE